MASFVERSHLLIAVSVVALEQNTGQWVQKVGSRHHMTVKAAAVRCGCRVEDESELPRLICICHAKV